ncbi:MAG TPA: NADH-ubiquinone oxidoreductase-F iron-sulfur binding region domain-containing protein [bacterium]|nr:NADH-ubiquinone oxidoreductase-F iron-sulfur binding region domain-containing protein [bacterium]
MKNIKESKFDRHALLTFAPSSYAKYEEWHGAPAREALALSPLQVIEAIERSGLRGRGGAGFPTGRKWRSLCEHPCQTRYAVCNAAEGEPGTFKDRLLLRKNPYAVLEGLTMAAATIGAKAAYVVLKASFELEIAALKKAWHEMKQRAGFNRLPLHFIQGPEEYLLGEEKALLNVIENEGPFPRPADEPPYERGLFATPVSSNPALVNNAETLAHVATILRHGDESFRRLGTEDTPGTILVTLSGDVARPGVYEVKAGRTLRSLLQEEGGGPVEGRGWKGLLCGVSAALIPPEKLDTPAEFGALRAIGSNLGSAGFIALGERAPMRAVAEALARFLYVESCNQCSACKAGLRQAWRELGEDPAKELDDHDLDELLAGAETAPQGNRCYLPVQGSQLIPSLVGRFGAEIRKPAKAEWTLPKIVDYDEKSHRFTYDERQKLKQPDWTYAEPAGAASIREGSPAHGNLI